MRSVRATALLCIATIGLASCDRQPSSVEPDSDPRVAIPPNAAAAWYPTNPDGSPDYNAETTLSYEYANATVTGLAPSFDARIEAGFTMVGSKGYINIYPTVTKNHGQSESTNPHLYPIEAPNGTAGLKVTTFQHLVNATCEVAVGGFVDFAAWFEANTVRWSQRFATGNVQPANGGPDCKSPWVTVSPMSIIDPVVVTAGASVTLQAKS